MNGLVAATDPGNYRSTERNGGAAWGMTMGELMALKGEPTRREADRLVFDETVNGLAVASTYVFPGGKLADIESRWTGPEVPISRLEGGLRAEYGAPFSRWDREHTMTELLVHRPVRFDDEWDRLAAKAVSAPTYEITWLTPETNVVLVSGNGAPTGVRLSSRVLGGGP
jgi:hypothetical protein